MGGRLMAHGLRGPARYRYTDSIRIRPARKVAITSCTSMPTRSDSQIPWDKVGIDYLGTQECMGKHGKVRNRGLVGAARVGAGVQA